MQKTVFISGPSWKKKQEIDKYLKHLTYLQKLSSKILRLISDLYCFDHVWAYMYFSFSIVSWVLVLFLKRRNSEISIESIIIIIILI